MDSRPDGPLSDDELAKLYFDAAGDYAQAHVLRLYGSTHRPTDELELWRTYEMERIRRGYRTFPLEDFMSITASQLTWSRIMERRGVRENAIAHAESHIAYH